jgi:nucleotide-binding universal stress UspA family protein
MEVQMYKHILIPTDGTELSQKAVNHGIGLAKALNAKVTAVTVSEPFHVFAVEPSMVTDTPDEYKRHIAALAAKYLKAAKDAATAAGVPCDVVHVENEHPYEAIIDRARKGGCDAIVMEWHCSISKQPGLPAELDEMAEASHESLPLAILSAFVEARHHSLTAGEGRPRSVPQIRLTQGYAICCDNFA